MHSVHTHSSDSPTETVSRARIAQLLPGLGLTALIASAAIELGKIDALQARGISALTLAIVLGMLVGNTLHPRIADLGAAGGVGFAKQNLLRAGIVLYGLRLTFQDIGHVGVAGVLIDACVLCSTFALAWLLGTRVFGLDRNTALLIGAGSSICGAAAVMATGPVVKGRAEQVTVAVATVVVFGTLAIFVYPALYHLNAQYGLVRMSPAAYGLFAGSTIHEVAQVVAAGNAVSATAADTAVIAKMVRVMMLAPFLVLLSAWISRAADARSAGVAPGRITVPWFAMGFVAVAGINSLVRLPAPLAHVATDIDTVMLAMAMAALGLSTHVSAIRQAGTKPLALSALLFVWLIAGGFAINAVVSAGLA